MAGYLLLPEPEPEGSAASPAVIVELAPLPVAPASPQDLAPGPEMVEAQPTPKPPPQAEPEVVEPTPKIEAPAEVTLPEPKPKAVEKKPEEPGHPEARDDAGPAEHAGAADDGGAALRAAHRGDAAGAEPRQRREPRRHRQLARPRGGAIAAEQALSGKRRGAARAGCGDAELQRGPQRPRAGAQHRAKLWGRGARRGGAGDGQRAQPLPAFPPAMTQHSVNLVVPIRFSLR